MKTRTVQLGDVCEFIRGVTFASGEASDVPADGSVACLTTSGVQRGVAWSSRRFIPKQRVKRKLLLGPAAEHYPAAAPHLIDINHQARGIGWGYGDFVSGVVDELAE